MIYDFIVIGAGIAGTSAAFELAGDSTVLLIEAERQPGYHSTGRSAALFTRNYGSPLVQRINALSEPFFSAPPQDFTEGPLLQPRGALAVAGLEDEARLDAVLACSTPRNPVVEMPPAEALAMVPFLRPERVTRAAYEKDVADIDVATLLHSYLKGLKKRGGKVLTGAPVTGLKNVAGIWEVSTAQGLYRAKTVINAAGAWADEIGALAGASRIGLVAKRRTAIVVDAPNGTPVSALPCVDFSSNDAYIKPEGGRLMASPGDATPTPPQDAQPDEMDVAVLADWIERETLIKVRRIAHKWAGLRSFVPDESPVVGRDTKAANFIWLAGQGGYGIMMAPALARAVASLCLKNKLPPDFVTSQITTEGLGPVRLGQNSAV